MTQSFLKTHFFRFQHKVESHKYTVSSAVQWIFKTEITQTADQNKIRFRRNIRLHSQLLTVRRLKIMLKHYKRKTGNDTAIFGNIINLSNRMFLIYIFSFI